MESTKRTITPDHLKEKENKLVVSYKTLRNLIGYCGMILPVILILATTKAPSDKIVESSFSDYYYTSSGDILVAFLCIVGALLFIYKGYSIKRKHPFNYCRNLRNLCCIQSYCNRQFETVFQCAYFIN